MRLQESRQLLARELAPLIRVEDLGRAIPADRLLHRVYAEVRRQRIKEPPGDWPSPGSHNDRRGRVASEE